MVKVVAGESLTEQQALEALLIPSADNVADILAQWDAGSLSAFVARMNAQARQLGMTRTHYTDPSGLAAATVSTARDQLVLTRSAMAIAAFARIVAMPAATLPVAGTVENFDYDVGHDGIIGVKTGSDSAALGCWAFAARHTIGGAVRTVYGVVLGIPATARGLVEPALAAGESLASAVSAALRPATVLPAGAIVGQVSAAWRATPVPVVTTRAVSGLVLAGARVVFDARMRTPAGDTVRPGQRVGTLVTEGVLGAGRTPLVADRAGRGPGLGWRLLRL